MNGPVLCVLVIYGRRPDQAVAWSWLREALGQEGRLSLEHLLVHDNSPTPDWAQLKADARLTLTHDPANGGTLAAYRAAAALAEEMGAARILLLDQDTELPDDYLVRIACADQEAEAIVPEVYDNGRLISPAWCSAWGGVTPTTDLSPRDKAGFVTAISSGALVSPSVLTGAEPFGRGMWLDYVDHWFFLALARSGGRVALASTVIDHKLSVADPAALSARRVESILDGESALAARLGWRARVALPLRRVIRALRQFRVNPDAALRVFARVLGSNPGEPPP